MIMATDEELMQYADSRMLKYPDKLHNTDNFESEETGDWDKAFALAELCKEKGYPVPQVDQYALAEHILKKWKAAKEATEGLKEKESGSNWYI